MTARLVRAVRIIRCRRGLASKILLPALALSLGVGTLLFFFFSAKFARQAEEDLRNRLETFLTTQAAELEGPVWEFDQAAIDRLFRSYALTPDLRTARLVDARGRVLARVRLAAQAEERVIADGRGLSRQAGGQTYDLGRLEVAFSDIRLRQALAAGRAVELPAVVGLAAIFVGVLALTVHWSVGKPLRRLRESLERNAAAGPRLPLSWDSADELGQVVAAYNAMLAEVNQHTGSLERANAGLRAENAQRRRAEKRLALYKAMVEATDAAMAIADRGLRIRETNAACLRITGFAAEELAGRQVWDTFLAGQKPDRIAAIGRSLENRAAWSGECRGVVREGRRVPYRVTINALALDDDAPSHHVLVFADISEQKATQKLLKSLAYTDSLTGLPNRALFMDRLEREIRIESRRGRGFALLFIDLDNFKWINDALSHAVGDQVLGVMAGRMQECLRAEDTLARMGGDEFTVILRETARPADIARVVETLLGRLSEPMSIDGQRLEVGGSVGVALYPADGLDSETLMKNADTAMYAAKADGGGQSRFFKPSIAEAAKARMELRARLRQAVAESEFVLHYQPIVDMVGGGAVHYEALVRWNSPEGLVYPNDFIAFAATEGLVGAIGRQVLDMAFAPLRDWGGGDEEATLAVNISRKQFVEEGFVADLVRRAQRHGVAPTRLVLELTASLIISDPAAVRAVMVRLIDHGFRIAVDDFGVGYSSLSVLLEYPVHIVKLDKSLVASLGHDPRAQAMVSGFISLFQNLGLEVVAEGVEHPAQHAFLLGAGCDMAQGWLYGKPLPAPFAAADARSLGRRLCALRRRDKNLPPTQ